MSEFRQDPLSRRWVIIGGERGGRPNEFVEAATRASGSDLPVLCRARSRNAAGDCHVSGQWQGDVAGPRGAEQVSGRDGRCDACPTCQPLSPMLPTGSCPALAGTK